MRIAVIFASLLMLSSTANAIEWSEWRAIANTESGLTHATLAGAPSMDIERYMSNENGGARREHWTWESGQMVMFDVGPGRYLERNSKKALREFVAEVAESKGLEISVSNSDIDRDHNKMGNYSYVSLQVDDPNTACFFFVQYFGNSVTAGYSGTSGITSRAFLRGVDCRSSATASLADHKGSMHMFMEGLTRQ